MHAQPIVDRPVSLGEIFDRAVVAVVRNAPPLLALTGAFVLPTLLLPVAADGTPTLWTALGTFVGLVVDLASFLALVAFLDAAVGGAPPRVVDALRSGIVRLPFALAACIPLTVLVGFVLFAVAFAGAIVGGALGGSVLHLNPLLQLGIYTVPALLALAASAYGLAFIGLTLTASALDTKSPTRALTLALAQLGSPASASRASLIAGAAGVTNLTMTIVAYSVGGLAAGFFGAASPIGKVVQFATVGSFGFLPFVFNTAVLVVLRRDLIVRREGVDLLAAVEAEAPSLS